MSADLQATTEIGRFGLAIRRRWRMIGLCAAGALALGGAWLVLTPTSATATAEVNVNVISSDPFSAQRTSSALLDPATEQQLIGSTDVLAKTAAELGGGATAGSIRRGLDAQMVTGSTIMRISWTGANAAGAQKVADAVAEQYLVYRGDLARQIQQDALTPLIQRRDALDNQLKNVKAGRTALLAEFNTVISQITKVSSLATSGGTVLTKATDTHPVISPRISQVLPAVLVLGLLAGAVIAVIDDIVRRRVHDASDVGAANSGPMLARLDARSEAELAEPGDADALQTVWHRLRIQIADDVPVMLVIGASNGAPVTAVAHALERAAATVDEAGGPQSSRRLRAVPVPAEEGYAVALSLAPRATVVVLAAEADRTLVRKLATLSDHLKAIGVEPAGTVVARRSLDTAATHAPTGLPRRIVTGPARAGSGSRETVAADRPPAQRTRAEARR